MTLTFSTLKVTILHDDDLSLISVLFYAKIKKWLSICDDTRSGHFCGLTCLLMHLPIISQWQKYWLPSNLTGSDTSDSCRIRLLLMSLVQLCISDPLKCHQRSHDDVTDIFLNVWETFQHCLHACLQGSV